MDSIHVYLHVSIYLVVSSPDLPYSRVRVVRSGDETTYLTMVQVVSQSELGYDIIFGLVVYQQHSRE